MSSKSEDPAVTCFRKYLTIKTNHPTPDYESAKIFLCDLAAEENLHVDVFEFAPGRPFVLMTLVGEKPELPSLLLNSHVDVVAVYPECWMYDPFSAHKDEKGNIYARGSQDMKCVGIQYFEALRRLRAQGKKFLRTIHLSWVPSEEITDVEGGMYAFANSARFRSLNVGLTLDEGVASEDDIYRIYTAERSAWQYKITCVGNPGHGSKFIENTAAERFQKVLTQALAFREEQKKLLENDSNLLPCDVITTNLTIIEGGVQQNVVPAELSLYLDMRMPPTVDYDAVEKMIRGWMDKAGPGNKLEFTQQIKHKHIDISRTENIWWPAIEKTMDKLGLKWRAETFMAGTDSKFIRAVGVPAVGFSPMINTPQLLHDHNEYLNETVFLTGIDIYCHWIDTLANVQ